MVTNNHVLLMLIYEASTSGFERQ